MKKYKKIILLAIILFQFCTLNIIYGLTLKGDETVTKENMLVWDGKSGWFWNNKWWANIYWVGDKVSIKDNFLKTILRYLLWIVWIVSLTVFIYIWYELATAEWKQDKFTKWIKALVYLVVGLAIIPLSYILIKITTWFTL